MQKQRTHLRPVVPVVIVAATALAACGGSDSDAESAESSASAPTTAAAPGEDADESADDAADEGASSGVAVGSLDEAQGCLEAGGYTLAPGDETSTGLTAEMMDNLGIDQILVFASAAGSAGTIEAYASSPQAELAAEGYEGSPLGYRVGAEGDVVFKTTGAPEVLDDIGACLRGESIEVGGDEAAAAEEVVEDGVEDDADESAEPVDHVDAAPEDVEEAVEDDVEQLAEEVEESAAPAGVSDDELGSARLAILDMAMTEEREAQGVIFDRACLEIWSLGLSDEDAELFAANDPAVSPEGAAQAERIFTCLDLDRLSVLYAEDAGYDVACVESAFAGVDIQAVVDERGADIDEIFRALADAAFECS